MWTHRPTIIGGTTAPNDREVLFNGRPVGRVYYAQNITLDTKWFWVCGSVHGYAATMADALEKVRQAYLVRAHNISESKQREP